VVYGFNAIKIFLDYLRKQKIKKFKIEKKFILTLFFLSPIISFLVNRIIFNPEFFGRLYVSFAKLIIENAVQNKFSLGFKFLDILSSMRLSLYAKAIDIFNQLPLINKIFGMGTTEYLSLSGRYIHNTYLECLLEGGIILLIVFIILNIRYYFFLFKFSNLTNFGKVTGLASNLCFLSLTLFYKMSPFSLLLILPIIIKKQNILGNSNYKPD